MLRRLSQISALLFAARCSLATNSTSSGGTGSSKDGYSSITLCSDSNIQVTSVVVGCDSSGTFYYGSGKYRDSETCKAGDKAKITITFDVINDLNGVDPLLTLSATGDSETINVYKNARLCYLGTLKSSSGSSCASLGSYTLSAQFYWTSSSNDKAFTPYVSVGFHSSKDPNKFDLGGANTKKCSGSIITTWSKNVRQTGALSTPLFAFLWSLLILIGTIGVLGMFAWYLWRRPSPTPNTFDQHYEYTDSLEDDNRKINMVGSNLGLVDF
jgi:hypothetical protein